MPKITFLFQVKLLMPTQRTQFVLQTFPFIIVQLGVTTNSKGEFVFNIPIKYKDSILCISYIGYEVIKEPLKKFTGKDEIYNFKLKSNVIALEKIKVLAKRKRIRPKKIVEKAINLIPQNYQKKSFLLSGYYRDYLYPVKKSG